MYLQPHSGCPCCSAERCPSPSYHTCRFTHRYLSMWWGIGAQCASSPDVILLSGHAVPRKDVSLFQYFVSLAPHAGARRTLLAYQLPTVGCVRRHQLQFSWAVRNSWTWARAHVSVTLSSCCLFVSYWRRVSFVIGLVAVSVFWHGNICAWW
jgi:hypothetical protein